MSILNILKHVMQWQGMAEKTLTRCQPEVARGSALAQWVQRGFLYLWNMTFVTLLANRLSYYSLIAAQTG